MLKKYIWQSKDWPDFRWNSEKILAPLSLARKEQGKTLELAREIGLNFDLNFFVEDVQKTALIEGEKLDLESVRSSVARRLGVKLAKNAKVDRHVDGLVEVLFDATTRSMNPLTEKRLHGWQASLFPTGFSGLHEIEVGKWRTSPEPMKVISGPVGKERIHFQAPDSNQISAEMKFFFDWFQTDQKIDGFIRAAVAHFWFVTIHPYDDGNGRLARAISDLALAQDEKLDRRYYSLSSQISRERKAYYQILEKTQKQDHCDLTDWIIWFLEILTVAFKDSQKQIGLAIQANHFWQKVAKFDLNERQRKVLAKMLEFEPGEFVGGMTNKKYVSIAKVSAASAKRDLADLGEKGLIKRNEAGGRSVSYRLSTRQAFRR